MKSLSRTISPLVAAGLLVLGAAGIAHALAPSEVLVVANKNAAKSEGLARYYMKKRQIPEQNLVLLFMTDKETCARQAYLTKAVPPIRRFLEAHPEIRAIVTLYGVPLRIASPGPTPEESRKLDPLVARRKKIEADLASGKIIDMVEKKKLQDQSKALNQQIRSLTRRMDKGASFDSELFLVKKQAYPINFWLPNPFFRPFAKQQGRISREDVIMVSRLDGADDTTVKRIIDQTLEAEQEGLEGTAYLDARWPMPKKPAQGGYGLYDQALHRTAKMLKKSGRIPVVLDQEKTLFQPGQCPDAALYCGWYSLAKYVDAFSWQKGAVGFHMASAECTTLKQPKSQVWCKKMLDDGICATIGPVGEPYIQAFPLPDLFFYYLSEGVLTLAESYLASLPYLSWKMVLVGDPLYRVNLSAP